MTKRSSWILLGVAAVCAALSGFWLARKLDSSAPPLASGTWLGAPRDTGSLRLTDQDGRPFTQASLQGKSSLVFFGYTHCPDVCPTTLAKLAQVKKSAGVPGLQVVFVSVDPQRDTPAVLSTYVHAFDPQFIGLTGEPTAIAALTSKFGIAVARVELPGGDYTMDHSAAVFLLNTHGQIAALFTPPFDVRQMAQDLRSAAPYLTGS
ncbi:MAG TPA: SCO family protein [Steroidobacteraceae bacterium]|nr:SCO family protein [Steroidobacteraceae bacterium]